MRFFSADGQLPAAMFCAGMFAMLAQMVVLRELLVAFYGNEITIGLSLAGWLLLTGAGSGLFGLAQRRCDSRRLAWIITGLLVWLALVAPAEVFLIRTAPRLLRIPFGEQAPPGWMAVFIAAALAPLCLPVGALFPAVCRQSARGRREPAGRAAGRIYAADALGGICAGGLFYAALVNLPGGMAPAVWAGGCGLAGAWLAAPRPWARRVCLGLLCVFCLFGVNYRLLARLEWAGIRLRWHSFGVLDSRAGGLGAARLLASVDSRYRNLALFESAGQKTLYSNGQVAFVFPDPVAAEFKIHFIMAQMPGARRVLLLGGNPPDDVPELLKYPLERLVCLEQDRSQTVLLQEFKRTSPGAEMDRRASFVAADGPRFIRECAGQFDVVIVGTAEPDTIAANRFFTAEFYRAVRRILAPDGFMYTALPTSEHLRGEALRLAASVEAALRLVFPRVLVTPGAVSHFFAGGPDSPITLDAPELYRRASAAEINGAYFTPGWLLDAEELAPDKTARVRQQLAVSAAPANTAFRPVSTFTVLTRWLQIGNLPVQKWIKWLQRINLRWIGYIVLAGGILAWLLVRAAAGRPAGRRRAFNGLLGYVVISTGFCEMALEITLVFVFQNVFGNIYAGLAMIMAVFMAGLAAGALLSARALAAEPGGGETANPAASARVWRGALAAELGLLAAACLVAPAMHWLLTVTKMPVGAAGAVYLLVGMAGLAAGAQFPLACRLWRPGDGGAESTPWINALDLTGAALGGVLPGIILLPLFGLADAMLLLAAVKAAGACCLLGAWRLAPGALAWPAGRKI